MKNILKKSSYLLLVILLLVVSFSFSSDSRIVHAKTLRNLKEELAAKEKELSEGKSQKELTEKQIEQKRNNIAAINQEIVNIQDETVKLGEEIERLNEEIKLKQKEIKQIINYYQLSNGESAYLEYVFNAVDFTDFIYRMAIAEQLSNYNDKLIDEYNATIKESEQKKKDLANKQVELNNKQKSLENELTSLGNQLGEIMDENTSLEDDIKSMKKLINTYENIYKCNLDEDVSNCGRDKLPIGTAFYRPTTVGYISSNYGIYNVWGYSQMHYGMDIAGMGHGAPVYAMADGRVSYITEKSSCGGNYVYIHHSINGKAYTTGYLHLASINVRVGDVVTTNTVIATVGGNPNIETWDSCSTGTHLHIQISTTNIPAGLYYYSRFSAKSFNPREVLNLPALGGWYYDRTSRY